MRCVSGWQKATDNDTLVRFKRANVIHASGTIGGNGGYPFFDMSSGGSLTGTIAAEEKMLSLSDDKTRIVADEGEPASAAEAIAAKPTQDLDARWAPRGGFLSGDVITRMAYQSLKGISLPAPR